MIVMELGVSACGRGIFMRRPYLLHSMVPSSEGGASGYRGPTRGLLTVFYESCITIGLAF